MRPALRDRLSRSFLPFSLSQPVTRILAPLVLGVGLPSALYATPLPDRPHVYVEGRAEIEVKPDQMEISVWLRETDEELTVAKSRLDERSGELIERLRNLGIEDRDLAATALHISPAFEYRDSQRVPIGTRVAREIDVTLRDLLQYPSVIEALIEADISHTVSTRFEVSKTDELTNQALLLALDDAQARAAAMAARQNRRLGNVYSISEFDLRQEERYFLYPTRGIQGRSTRSALAVADVAPAAPAQGRSEEPFAPGVMVASATVYVVYRLR